MSPPSHLWIAQQLVHPLFMGIVLPAYKLGGKYLLILLQQLHILSKAVHWKEKRGKKPGYFPRSLPGGLAVLASHQLQKLGRINQYRKHVAQLYEKALMSEHVLTPTFPDREHIYLRFPVRHTDAHGMIRKAWDKNMLIGDWYTSPVVPDDTQLDAVGYRKGSCPVAEKLAAETLNLPTHINMREQDVQDIIQFMKSYGGSRDTE
ncbi:MAG: DegT/DnrJ/EryC1/StrS family aminotransferase, partial [archaeon]|nr:DegT/DnrJ/EryC1/StrS family aminotransferase [archaeon]